MNDTTSGDPDTRSEPGLTQENSRTIKGEETLANDDTTVETSTRTGDGAVPTSYGARGGMTPDTDEGGDGTDADAEDDQ